MVKNSQFWQIIIEKNIKKSVKNKKSQNDLIWVSFERAWNADSEYVKTLR